MNVGVKILLNHGHWLCVLLSEEDAAQLLDNFTNTTHFGKDPSTVGGKCLLTGSSWSVRLDMAVAIHTVDSKDMVPAPATGANGSGLNPKRIM